MTMYILLSESGPSQEFTTYADLWNAFLAKYGFPPCRPKAMTGACRNVLFYWPAISEANPKSYYNLESKS